MLQRLHNRAKDEAGFTLIELLVVILIIGILAAIALPTFLGQQSKAQDTSAKTDARNTVSQMESCYTVNQTYAGCNKAVLEADGLTGPTLVDGAPVANGDTGISGQGASDYVIASQSKAGHTFTITKAAGVISRTCAPASKGACNAAGSW